MTREVSGAPRAISHRAHRRPRRASFDVVESKLHAPRPRIGIVHRSELLDRLTVPPAAPVIAVVAPSGYGKTTLLAQWADRKAPRAGWISADERDNDPAVLLTYVAEALHRIEPIDPAVFRGLASSGAATEGPRRLAGAMGGMSHPVALVIDHFEAVSSRACFDTIVALALALPPGSQLAIGSREAMPLPAARLRAQGGITEIGVDDLAMDADEAAALLAGAGVEMAESERRQLLAATEGWPVGLYLAALAVKTGGSHDEVRVPFTGDDRFMSDYLRSEFLGRVSRAEVSFLTRTSILDRMCGPLCDATLGETGSSAVLDGLESRNLLVVSLDRRRHWYRYHHLFRELLLSELRRREPGLVAALHRRAGLWCEANGMAEAAIDYAQAAGDTDTVARLVLRLANAVWASGRSDTVLRWMEWFEANHLIERYPAIAVHGALMFALEGRPAGTERWADAAETASTGGTLPDGNTMEGTLAYLRALRCRSGLVDMRRNAAMALDGLTPASPYRATMLHAEAVSYLLEGDLERADAIFARAVDAATLSGSQPFVPLLLAERGIAAIERDDWPAADAFAEQAIPMMKNGRFDKYWTSALVYAWAARVAMHRGDPEDGRHLVARAARLRPLLNYALPVVSVQALLEMARSYIALTDQGGAQAVLRQAYSIFQQRPSLGLLPSVAEKLQAQADTLRTRALGASSLTAAELRLVPLLPTHLSFREIGERLYVSRHTVKTQAISIYRKLGVSSRAETISRMQELGLLERA